MCRSMCVAPRATAAQVVAPDGTCDAEDGESGVATESAAEGLARDFLVAHGDLLGTRLDNLEVRNVKRARGKWVALVGSRMVAAGEALAEVMESLKSMEPKPVKATAPRRSPTPRSRTSKEVRSPCAARWVDTGA